MKRLCLALLAIIAFPRFADAADLPSNKDAGAAAATPDCFSSFWSYLNSSPENCPLSYAGFTLYGALDGGYGYSEHGAPLNPNADKVNYAIARNSNGALWQWSPNGLSTSAVGIRMKEDIADGWSLVGVVEAGINPFTGRLINGPKSQADNNLTKQANQDTNFG